MIKYITGNLFDTKANMIAHGVNCMGAFNAGIAKQIGEKFPQAKAAYLDKFQKQGWILGEVQIVDIVPKGTIKLDSGTYKFFKVANCATQQGYGYKQHQKVYVDYAAVGICFNRLFNFCDSYRMNLALPRIGAGLAGGDWEIIRGLLEDTFADKNVNVEVYTL